MVRFHPGRFVAFAYVDEAIGITLVSCRVSHILFVCISRGSVFQNNGLLANPPHVVLPDIMLVLPLAECSGRLGTYKLLKQCQVFFVNLPSAVVARALSALGKAVELLLDFLVLRNGFNAVHLLLENL